MSNQVTQGIMVIASVPPHGSSDLAEGLDMVLALLAFELEVSLLFLDDGVLQLKKHQQPAKTGRKHIAPAFSSLALYDIRHIYANEEAMALRGLKAQDLVINVEIVNRDQIPALIAQQRHVIRF